MEKKKSNNPEWQELKNFLQNGNLNNWESYKMVSDFDYRNSKSKQQEEEKQQ